MTDPFDDLMKFLHQTTSEYVTWQKIRKMQSGSDLIQTLRTILPKDNEIFKYDDAIKSLTTDNKAMALAAKYKNLYVMYWFFSEALLELLYRIVHETEELKPVIDSSDPKMESMIAKQVRIEVAKELKKSKTKHDSKRKKQSS